MASIQIPPERLADAVLDALLEAYVLREGTDYGWRENSLEEKVGHLRRQVHGGETVIVYDESSQSFNLLSRDDYQKNGCSSRK